MITQENINEDTLLDDSDIILSEEDIRRNKEFMDSQERSLSNLPEDSFNYWDPMDDYSELDYIPYEECKNNITLEIDGLEDINDSNIKNLTLI